MIYNNKCFEEHKEGLVGSNLSQLHNTPNSQNIQTIFDSFSSHSDVPKETSTTSKRNLFDKLIDSESAEISSDSEKKLCTPTLMPQAITPTSSAHNRDDGKV